MRSFFGRRLSHLLTNRGVDSPLRKVREETGRSRRALLLFTVLALLCAPPVTRICEANPPLALQGRLLVTPGTGPLLRMHGKDTPLAAKTPFFFHTLQDKRLLNREVRLEGAERPDGVFEVERLYTVRNGKLYRVRYFCEICNIEALEPGDCVCCQQPTELQEIPVNETDKEILITH